MGVRAAWYTQGLNSNVRSWILLSYSSAGEVFDSRLFGPLLESNSCLRAKKLLESNVRRLFAVCHRGRPVWQNENGCNKQCAPEHMWGARGCEPSLPRGLVNAAVLTPNATGALEQPNRATYAGSMRVCARGALKRSKTTPLRAVMLSGAASNTDRPALFDTVKHPAAAVLAHEF
jgi:hypothetical protein